METYKDLPLAEFESAGQWREWLDQNHSRQVGVWLKFAKKGGAAKTLSYEEARDNAIAYGWIDGLINKFDADFYVTRFTPRKANSSWSKINCDVVERLITDGLMHPAGLLHVERAKADGRWELAYDSQSKMSVPTDFQAELDLNPQASACFLSLTAANRYSFLYRIQTAKTAKARQNWIERSIKMLNAGECFHPQIEQKS